MSLVRAIVATGGGSEPAFYVVFGVFVAAFLVLAVVTLRWAVRRDRAGRAAWVRRRQDAEAAEKSETRKKAGPAEKSGRAKRAETAKRAGAAAEAKKR